MLLVATFVAAGIAGIVMDEVSIVYGDRFALLIWMGFVLILVGAVIALSAAIE
jgi:hypothetical protein